MAHGKNPLILMAALTLPGAAHALGLGEIHVDSPLNQPLDAKIDIIGASAEDLIGITASVADPETFRRFGADRPSFLSSIAFKVTRDSKGRPVLAVRSTDAFYEPVVNILIDLRWRGGELIRQYSLLLDPAAAPSAIRVATGLPIAGPPVIYATMAATPKPAVAISEAVLPRKTIKIGARATLRGVAWRAGARSDAELKRMMVAIFQANPGAFEGNINRLRLGAVLTIPVASEVSVISVVDAKREIRAQMQAWRTSNKLAGAVKSAAPTVAVPAVPALMAPTVAAQAVPAPALALTAVAAPVVAAPAVAAPSQESTDGEAALNLRVQILEKKLGDLQVQLDREHDRLTAVQATVADAANAPAAALDPPVGARSGRAASFIIAAALAFLAGALGVLHAWRRRRALKPRISSSTAVQKAPEDTVPAVTAEPSPRVPTADELHRDQRFDATLQRVRNEYRQSIAEASPRAPTIREPEAPDNIDVQSLEASYVLEAGGDGMEDTQTLADLDETATLPDASADTMPVETVRMTGSAGPAIDTTKLDYNLMDLDVSVHHVQMPSMLHDSVPFKERRTSLVDVLKIAVEREPNRRDLRMKLLETYYAAAAVNRQGFLEAVQRLARERENMSDEEWNRIAWMGRQIAPSNDLFVSNTAQTDDEDLADCA